MRSLERSYGRIALDETDRAALVEDISGALQAYRDPEGLAIPQGTHIDPAKK